MKRLLIAILLVARSALGQSAADGPVLEARGLDSTASINLYFPAGSVRLVAWDRDSIVVRGQKARNARLFFGATRQGVKMGLEGTAPRDSEPSNLVIYMPRRGRISVRTASANIVGEGVSGDFNSSSGNIRLSGIVSSVEAESMNGSLDLDLTTPWLRARTGDGHLLIRGAPQDVDASTIGGTLDVIAPKVMRGQFVSVSGDIHWIGSPARGAVFDFSNHSGAVDLALSASASAALTLSSVSGPIENGFTRIRPIASPPRTLRFNLGDGDAHVSVRTFKGAIRVRPE
jgi:putative adhesin